MTDANDGSGAGRLVLLVAGGAPGSRRARDNLSAALRDGHRSGEAVTEIDVFEKPRVALGYGVFATPALVWDLGGSAAAVLYGDLSDGAALRRFLGEGGGPS